MSFFDELKKKALGVAAQVTPSFIDHGATYASVQAPRVQTPQIQAAPIRTAPSPATNFKNSFVTPTLKTVSPLARAIPSFKNTAKLGAGLATGNFTAAHNALNAEIKNTSGDREAIRQMVTRPVAQAVATISKPKISNDVTYHPGSRVEKFAFGDRPVQSIQQGARTNYQQHPNLPKPARMGLAGLYAAGQVLNDAPIGTAVTKGTKIAVKAATPVVVRGAKVADKVAFTPRVVHNDQLTLQDLSNHYSGAKPLKPQELSQTQAKARQIAQKHGVDISQGTQNQRHEAVNAILDKVSKENRAMNQGGYARLPGAGSRGKLPQTPGRAPSSAGVAREANAGGISSEGSIAAPSMQEIMANRVFEQNPMNSNLGRRDFGRDPLPLPIQRNGTQPIEQLPRIKSQVDQASDLSSNPSGGRRDLSGQALDIPSTNRFSTQGRLPGELSPTVTSRLGSLGPEGQGSRGMLDENLSEPAYPRPLTGTSADHSLDLGIPQDIIEAKAKGTYPIDRKIAPWDYFRTPDRALDKIGLGDQAEALVNANRSYTRTLPAEIDKISAWRQRVGNNEEASQRIFKYLDGQKGATVSGEEKAVAEEMKQYLSEWADRLHLPAESRLTNYITHIFEKELLQKEFDPDLARLIQDKIPGSVYDPFTEQRLGAQGYVEDAFRALEAYTKRASRKEAFDPALESLKGAAQGLDVESEKFVQRYANRINMRPTEFDNMLDNGIKQVFGYKLGQRPTAAISQGVRQATYRATLGLNVGSAVRNLTQGINTFTELGSKWTTVGYKQAVEALAKNSDELKRVGVLDNSFIEDRTISSYKQGLQKLDKGLFVLFEGAERINRGAAFFGAKAKALSSGLSEEQAVKAGIDAARKTQFTFGRVDTPVALQGDLVKLLSQFQSYNVKQVEFISELVKNKEYVKLLRFTGATTVVFFGMSKALGYKPEDMLPFGSNVTQGSSPIGGAPAFKVAGAIKDLGTAVFTKQSENATKSKTEKVQTAGMKAADKIASATLPAFSQGKKTITGIRAVQRGEVRKGKDTVKVSQTPGNYAKAAVFGQYSLNGEKKKGSTVKTSAATSDTSERMSSKDAVATGLNTPEAKQFLALSATDQRSLAQSDSNARAIYDQKQAIEKAYTAPGLHSYGTSPESATTLDKYNRLNDSGKKQFEKNFDNVYSLKQAQAEDKLRALNPNDTDGLKEAEYKATRDLLPYDLAKSAGVKTADEYKAYTESPRGKFEVMDQQYQLDKQNGKISDIDDYQIQDKLFKAQVQAPYSKEAVDILGMSERRILDFLSKTSPDDKLYQELVALDADNVNAGVYKNSKLDGGTGGSGGRGSKASLEALKSMPIVKISGAKHFKSHKVTTRKRSGKGKIRTISTNPKVRVS